jgi:hypothetical protein
MLQNIRDGLHRHKWLGYIVLGALALVFAAWGAYGIVNLNIDNANYAAEAGGQKISIQGRATPGAARRAACSRASAVPTFRPCCATASRTRCSRA